MPDILALVPARGGSKSLPHKNLRLLQGHPLVAWAIAAGLQARLVSRTVCSTDDPEIAGVARRYGAEVPFLRPSHLGLDLTTDLPVFQHALGWFDRHEGWKPDIIVQLRPTSPLRPPGLVDAAIEALDADAGATSVRAVCPAPCNPYKMWRLGESGNPLFPYMQPLLDVPGILEPFNAPRQSLPQVWWQIGTIDAVRAEVIRSGSMTGSKVLPLRVDAQYAVDIDGELALRYAETLAQGLTIVRPGPVGDWGRIKLLVLDVDGTLTTGSMFYSPDGEALKCFHTHDGRGISMLQERGIEVVIISQEDNGFTAARAAKLGIREVHVNVRDKLSCLREISSRNHVELDEIAYVGDDMGDVASMLAVREAGGISCAPADARPEAVAAASYVCAKCGGRGAVRDVCDRILAARAERQ